MSGRARLYTLLAQAEAMRLAGLGRAMGQAQGDLARAEALEARLRRLVAGLPVTAGPVSGAMLRDTGLMVTALAAEAVQQQGIAAAAQARIVTMRSRMVIHDTRRRSAGQAAREARLAEVESAQDRLEASLPPPRLR